MSLAIAVASKQHSSKKPKLKTKKAAMKRLFAER
jgi:hypothetical protein